MKIDVNTIAGLHAAGKSAGKEIPTKRSPLFVLLVLSLFLGAGCGKPSNVNTTPPPPVETKRSKATFVAVGDIMLSRGVKGVIERAKDPLVVFSKLDELLSGTDFNFGNLESPVSGNDKREGKGLVFNARTQDTQGLVKYKFKIVNLANNHALDQGINGLRFTRSHLAGSGIKFVGAGDTLEEAWAPEVVEANGIRIAFIGASYASINDGGVATNNYVARIEDRENLRRSIEKARAESDLVVVTFHAGIEYTRKPHQPQIDFARAAVDFGADVVIGGHPHWIQTLEEYKGKYIFYSLGNFIFDQRKPDTKEGLVLKIGVAKEEGASGKKTTIDRIDLIPVIIEQLAIPRPVSNAESAAILKKIGITDPVLIPGK